MDFVVWRSESVPDIADLLFIPCDSSQLVQPGVSCAHNLEPLHDWGEDT